MPAPFLRLFVGPLLALLVPTAALAALPSEKAGAEARNKRRAAEAASESANPKTKPVPIAERVKDPLLAVQACERIYNETSPRGKESQAEVAVMAGWCFLAGGDIERAHAQAEIAIGLSERTGTLIHSELILARTSVMTCDYNKAEYYLERARERLPDIGSQLQPGDMNGLAQDEALRLIIQRTDVTTSYVRRALKEVGITLVVGDAGQANPEMTARRNEYRKLVGEAAEGSASTKELRTARAVLPDFCPTFGDATEKKRYIPNEAREATKNDEGSKVVCPYPENKAELTFEEEELDIVFRDWVEAISPSCSRFEADEIAVDPQEMAAVFNKYPKVRDIVLPALKKTGTAYFPMPRLYGKLMDDGRALQYSYVSDDEVLKSYNEQLQKFGELLIYESRDNLPKALTDLASLECRLTYILSARGEENQAKDYLEGSIQHYLLATDVAKETNSSDPAFVLEAGVMAKINDDLGRACTLFDRVVSEFPGSKEAVDAQMYIAVSCMRFYQTAENERIAAEEAKQEKSGTPNKGAAPVATRKLDTNAALARLQQASNTSDPIKRSMAIYSQAMMYKSQGDYKTASELLLRVVDTFIDQGKGPVQNDWRTETIEEYLYVCTQTSSCDFTRLVKLQSYAKSGSLAFEVARKTVEEVSKFEYPSCGEKLRETERILGPALQLATSDGDKALITLMIAIESLRCEATAQTFGQLEKALGYWGPRSSAETQAAHDPRVDTLAIELMTAFVNESFDKMWYVPDYDFVGSPTLKPEQYRPASRSLELAGALQQALATIGSRAGAVRTGLCAMRLYAYHVAQISKAETKELKKGQKVDAARIVQWWRKTFEIYDYTVATYPGRDYAIADWDFRGDMLIQTRDAMQTWLRKLDQDPDVDYRQNLDRLEAYLSGAIDSLLLKPEDEPRYYSNKFKTLILIFQYVNADKKDLKEYDNTKLQEAKVVLNAMRRRMPSAKETDEASKIYGDIALGMTQATCTDPYACLQDAKKLEKAAAKGGACPAFMPALIKAAELTDRAYRFKEARALWEKVRTALDGQCTPAKFTADGDAEKWNTVYHAATLGIARNALFLGEWDIASSALRKGLPTCIAKNEGELCMEMQARAQAAKGAYNDAIDTLQSLIQSPPAKGEKAEDKEKRIGKDFIYVATRYASRFCAVTENRACTGQVAKLIEQATTKAKSAGGWSRPEVRATLNEAQWNLGLSYWATGEYEKAHDTWTKCGKSSDSKDKNYFQLLCDTRSGLIRELNRAAAKLAKADGYEDIPVLEKQFVYLSREMSRRSADSVNGLLKIKKADPMIAVGDAWYRAYSELGKAMERIAPEAEELINSVGERAEQYKTLGSNMYAQFLFGGGEGGEPPPPFDPNQKLLLLPPTQFDVYQLGPGSGDNFPQGLPGPVANLVTEAMIDGRFDVPFLLLDDWCKRTNPSTEPTISAAACNALGTTLALQGQFSPAILYYNEAAAILPESRGLLNYALLARSFGALSTATDLCTKFTEMNEGTPIAKLCESTGDGQSDVENATKLCSAEPALCIARPSLWQAWLSRTMSTPGRVASLYGSMRTSDYYLSRE